MAAPRCYNCVYSCVDPERWLRCLCRGEPLMPRCANHPQWPGQMHDVPGTACRNYRTRPILPEGDAVRLIPLGDGYYAYVDAADYDWLSRYTWHLNNGYASRRAKGRRIYMHAQIMQPVKGMVVDHIDGNNANNCRFNLRLCTQAENLRNRRSRYGSSSRFKGVGYDQEHQKWFARCRLEGQREWLGYFDDEIEAAHVYDHAAVEYFGEFARLNFPEEWPPERRAEVYAQQEAAKRKGKKARRSEGKSTGRTTSRRTDPRATATTKEGRAKRRGTGSGFGCRCRDYPPQEFGGRY